MEYEEIINLLDDTKNEPSKFRTTNWVDINDESRGTYNKMIRSNLCDYSDVHANVKGNCKGSCKQSSTRHRSK